MKAENEICSICGSPTFYINSLYDDRYGYPGAFILFGCKRCGYKFLKENFSFEQLADLYTNYYPRSSFTLEEYKPHAEVKGFKAWLDGARRAAFRWVPGNVRVLDIGCGFGETLGYHKARGCDVYGVEADENIRRVAEKYGFKVHVGLFDPDLYPQDFFDFVTMDQVIEHVTDPMAALKGIARVLKSGGKAIISTPNSDGWGAKVFGRRWINWHAPYHLHHFSARSMTNLAERAGLNIERHKTVTSSDWLYFQWNHLLTFPAEGQPSGFWSPAARLNTWQFILSKLLFLMHISKINHVLTRLFDALGIGDNYLFVLRKK